jgi:hypothetical protein
VPHPVKDMMMNFYTQKDKTTKWKKETSSKNIWTHSWHISFHFLGIKSQVKDATSPTDYYKY